MKQPDLGTVSIDWRAGVEEFGEKRTYLQGGSCYTELCIKPGAVIHAEQGEWGRARPPMTLMPVGSSELHYSWCGVGLRMILPQRFGQGHTQACPACLEAMDRGWPTLVSWIRRKVPI